MSYRSMLKQRCTILELVETIDDGAPNVAWQVKAENVPCLLDLNFIRKGKDPMWTPEGGRPADRSGVIFFLGDAPIQSGDRILMTKGPAGTFSTEGAFDEAWTPKGRHHIEIGVLEVASQRARGAYSQQGGSGA